MPTSQLPPPLLFHPQPEADALAKIIETGRAARAKAESWPSRLDDAKGRVTDARQTFETELSDSAASNFARATQTLSDIELAAGAIERLGGPAIFEERILSSPRSYRILEGIARKRREALAKLIRPGQKAVATHVSEMIENGVHPQLAANHHTTRMLRIFVEQVVNDDNNTAAIINFLEADGVSQTPRKFSELRDLLTSPLPVAPTPTASES